jgi:hypothetical protein
MNKIKIVLIFIIFLHLNHQGFSQNESRFDFFIGYVYYEAFNIGGEYILNSNKQSYSLSIGYDKLNRQENFALALGYNIAILRSFKTNSDTYKWYIDNKAVLWQMEDNYYIWRAISLIPSINRRFDIYRNIKMSFDIGPSFNIILYNKRKTFKEIGWPYHVTPDFRILFIYLI